MGRACAALSAWKAAFMIESIMYFGIGFLFAALSVLVVVPPVHGRAVRLTRRRLEGATPSSRAEILAHKDLLRADFAITTRRLEMNVEQLKTKNASQLAELGKKGDAINRLKIELGALRDQLRATEEEFAVKATAVHEAERALSDKGSKLAKLVGELDERSTLADAQKIEIIALKNQVELKDTAVREAERALSDKESKLVKLVGELDQRSTLADAQKIEIIALKTQVEAKATAVREAERALSDKESKLVKLVGELDERSTLADAQKIEISALKTQVEALKERLNGTSNELKAVEDRRDAERVELKAATQKLMEERELELKHLRDEIEIARKAEADLRVAIIEI